MKGIVRHFVVLMGCMGMMFSLAYADSTASNSQSNSQSAFGSSSGKTESGGDSGRFGVGVALFISRRWPPFLVVGGLRVKL